MANLAKRPSTEDQSRALLVTIPRDILDYHLKRSKEAEEAYWHSGELSIELIEMYYPEYSKAAIRKTVGEIYNIGINTVRDRERVAGCVALELREKIPFLKSSHWRCIVPLEPKKIKDIVYQSIAVFQAEGKGPTVDQMKAWTGSKGSRTALPWMYRNEEALEKMEMIRDDHYADPEIRMVYEKTIAEVEVRSKKLNLARHLLGDGEEDQAKMDLE